VSSRRSGVSVAEPGELQHLLAAIHWQQQSPGVNPQEMLHNLQRLIDSRSWEGAVDDDGQPMNFRRALEEDWPTGVGLTESRRGRLFALAEGYPECKDMLADVRQRIVQLLPLDEPGGDRKSAQRDQSDNVTLKRGNSESYLRRRLARDRPDLYERVNAGELSAHAAAIEAGFRKPTVTVPVDSAEAAVRALARRFTVADLRAALEALR